MASGESIFTGEDEADLLRQHQRLLGPLPKRIERGLQRRGQAYEAVEPAAMTNLCDEGYEKTLGERGLGLLRTVLELDPGKRATCAQAAAHEWLADAL